MVAVIVVVGVLVFGALVLFTAAMVNNRSLPPGTDPGQIPVFPETPANPDSPKATVLYRCSSRPHRLCQRCDAENDYRSTVCCVCGERL